MQCYICNSSEIRENAHESGCQILRCSHCGLIWIEHISNRDIDDFYAKEYFFSDSKVGYSDYLSDEENHRLNAKYLLKILGKYVSPNQNRLLDVGCAYGFCLDEARKSGYRVFGVELSEVGHSYAVNTLKLDVRRGDLLSAKFETGFFDAVFLIGTVEHLKDPKSVLSEIYRILKDTGVLLITTIDTKGFLPFYSIKPPEHLFYFSHRNIQQLLTHLKFHILTIKPYFVNYKIHDLFFRLGAFLGRKWLVNMSKLFSKMFPKFSLKVPTNEMIIVLKK